ncbi:hypothetical protein LOD99_16262 [Oopsacas minuta]|uniref:Uncharacterized protein n=1 Tax=Oopsacas minuta TaxID=111878 RepID=A0AAV7K7P0_9METZ|nr:hypothetical protein LOD99_16262 [Oopsacas minuta]
MASIAVKRNFIEQIDETRKKIRDSFKRSHEALQLRENCLLSRVDQVEDNYNSKHQGMNTLVEALEKNKSFSAEILNSNVLADTHIGVEALINKKIEELYLSVDTNSIEFVWNNQFENDIEQLGSIKLNSQTIISPTQTPPQANPILDYMDKQQPTAYCKEYSDKKAPSKLNAYRGGYKGGRNIDRGGLGDRKRDQDGVREVFGDRNIGRESLGDRNRDRGGRRDRIGDRDRDIGGYREGFGDRNKNRAMSRREFGDRDTDREGSRREFGDRDRVRGGHRRESRNRDKDGNDRRDGFGERNIGMESLGERNRDRDSCRDRFRDRDRAREGSRRESGDKDKDGNGRRDRIGDRDRDIGGYRGGFGGRSIGRFADRDRDIGGLGDRNKNPEIPVRDFGYRDRAREGYRGGLRDRNRDGNGPREGLGDRNSSTSTIFSYQAAP